MLVCPVFADRSRMSLTHHLVDFGDAACALFFSSRVRMTIGSRLDALLGLLDPAVVRSCALGAAPLVVVWLWFRFLRVPAAERAVYFAWTPPAEIRCVTHASKCTRALTHFRVQLFLDRPHPLSPIHRFAPFRPVPRSSRDRAARLLSLLHHLLRARVCAAHRHTPLAQCRRDSRADRKGGRGAEGLEGQ